LATSDDIQGLLAQGRTVQETIEIARNVAKASTELREGDDIAAMFVPTADSFDYPLVVNVQWGDCI
jgi:hypothetical protein